jgi:UDP-N-acetylmuramoyl-tripeptide--D-alanyl-D-alanine ligase
MTFLSTTWVAKALGQAAPSDESRLDQITADSREVKPGALFIALVGENSDGHDFIEKARASGAKAVVHRRDFTPPKDLISFPVEDTLHAWRLIAKAWRAEVRAPVAVVAGSAGKTTSKELLAALFRGKWKNVLQTQASQNGFQGVPTTLLRLGADTQAAVIEVGIDDKGAMIQHLDLVQPDAGLLTSIGPEHLEKLIDLDTVEKEEGLLFTILEQRKGLAAVNLDDERIARQGQQLRAAHHLTYSLRGPAQVRGHLEVAGESLFINVEGIAPAPVRFPVPLEGSHNALNLLGAIALAHGLGLTAEEMQRGLNTFTPPPGRSEVHHWNGIKVMADTYNANPTSVTAALETLFAGNLSGETWVCLGDMLEMGSLEESLHRGLAEPLQRYGVKHVFLYGPRMKWLADELKKKGFAGTVEHYEAHETMAARLKGSVKAGDRVLLKGSRGMRMENVWKALQV